MLSTKLCLNFVDFLRAFASSLPQESCSGDKVSKGVFTFKHLSSYIVCSVEYGGCGDVI